MKENEDFGIFAANLDGVDGKDLSGEDFARLVSENLHSNKDFMKRAVSYNPRCLAAAVGALSKDYDLAVIALSYDDFDNKPTNQDGSEYDYSSEREFVYDVAAKARAQVLAYEGMMTFLFGVTSNNPGPDGCLPMLNPGAETRKGFTEKVVGYVGVPPALAVSGQPR
jgi:hypothetical protein